MGAVSILLKLCRLLPRQPSTMMLLNAYALFLLLSSTFSLYLNDTIPMEMEAASLSEHEMSLLEKGELDQKTMVTYSIKVYVTPEVKATYSNYTESVKYLIEIVNKQYRRSRIPLKAKLHCIEETETSEAEGMNDYSVFDKSKGSVEELRGSADLAVLFDLKRASGMAGGQVLACNLPESLRTRIVFG